jgi:hypothetical protein
MTKYVKNHSTSKKELTQFSVGAHLCVRPVETVCAPNVCASFVVKYFYHKVHKIYKAGEKMKNLISRPPNSILNMANLISNVANSISGLANSILNDVH